MRRFEPMFGFDEISLRNLYNTCWIKRGACSGEWDSFPDFVQWAKENGYRKMMRICAIDPAIPLGPGNAVFIAPDGQIASGQDWKFREPPKSNPCQGCRREQSCEKPCLKRYQWWDVKMQELRAILGVDKGHE